MIKVPPHCNRVRSPFNNVLEERTLLEIIKRRKGNWIGHIFRRKSILTTVIEVTGSGKMRKGRRRLKMMPGMEKQETEKEG